MQADADRAKFLRPPTFDLKWSVMWNVVVVGLLCFLGAATISVYKVAEEGWQTNKSIGDAVGKHLEVHLVLRHRFADVQSFFFDTAAVYTNVMKPGQCVQYVSSAVTNVMKPDQYVQYVSSAGKNGISHCLGFNNQGKEAPEWFSALYRHTLGRRMSYERPVMQRGVAIGKVVVSSTQAALTASAWSDISRMLGLSAATVAALCILIYFVIERALRPTGDIVAGLYRLAAGDLKCRLPRFRVAELQRISDVFNELATTLEATIFERAGLARRLVDAREQERRHLARVLHDELAQSLSAMSATAASIKITATTDCPSLVSEAEALAENASKIMKGLRCTLQQLRPQEIDDLGLLGSLEGLIANHNHRSRGETKFAIEAHGDVNALPSAMSVHIFHIVQEGLTNAVKHARAAKVRAVVRVCPAQDGSPKTGAGAIEVTVEDDGAGMARQEEGEAGFGLGLMGIRERVLALGGQMAILSKPEKGLMLSATIPISIAKAPGPAP